MLDALIEKNNQLSNTIFQEIEKIVKSNNDITYIEAIVHYSEKNNIEIETIAELIMKNPQAKSKLLNDGLKLHLIKKMSATLPI